MVYEYNGINEKCPLPLVNMRLILKKMTASDLCVIKISDQGSKQDIPKYLTEKGYDFSLQQLDSSIVELQIKTGKLT